jgi:hypothetical protein
MKKLAIASAIALMSMGAVQAQTVINATAIQTDIASLADAATFVTDVGGLVTAPVINITSGAMNLAAINGAIDISGTNVSLSSMANNVSATATATATTSTADAYAIAGAKLSTTVIGAMNSSTVEVMGMVTEQSNALGQMTGLGSMAMQDGTAVISTTSIDQALAAIGAGNTAALGNGIVSAELLNLGGTGAQVDLANLTSEITSTTTSKVSELQNMNVFNAAINAASLDGGIKVYAAVDPNAWFLNPQTGVVNLANVAMSTTVIGAMNSATTRLGANLSTPTVTVK